MENATQPVVTINGVVAATYECQYVQTTNCITRKNAMKRGTTNDRQPARIHRVAPCNCGGDLQLHGTPQNSGVCLDVQQRDAVGDVHGDVSGTLGSSHRTDTHNSDVYSILRNVGIAVEKLLYEGEEGMKEHKFEDPIEKTKIERILEFINFKIAVILFGIGIAMHIQYITEGNIDFSQLVIYDVVVYSGDPSVCLALWVAELGLICLVLSPIVEFEIEMIKILFREGLK